MKFVRYGDIAGIKADTFDLLLQNELENNLLISIICDVGALYSPNWLLGTVKGDAGEVLLAAVCTPPFNIQIYDTGLCRSGDALKFLARELRGIGYEAPGVLASGKTARTFAEIYAPAGFKLHMSMNIMMLDTAASVGKVPGYCRALRDDDMYFAPYWERAFSEDCRVETFDIAENVRRLKARVPRSTHFIWEDGVPVSQAVHGRSTPNVAVVNGVYTPPHFRGRGYASSVVAELSNSLFERGFSCCCLFADAENPVSCGLYRKLGYRDVCGFDDIRFA